MSRRVIHHHDGSKTVYFENGNKARFGPPREKARPAGKKINGTPYVFAAGPKIELPKGVAHGMLFERRGKSYVALAYAGVDRMGRKVNVAYGQPIRLTRPA